MSNKRIIWSSNISLSDWEDWLHDWYPEITDESEQYAICKEENTKSLEEDKANLGKTHYPYPILCIADIGRWYGRFPAWRFIGNEYEGASLSDIFSFSEGENQEFFVEGGELCCDDSHHDATNHYTYRLFTCNPDDAEKLLDTIAMRGDYEPLLDTYTRSLAEDVGKVFGWK